MSQPQVEGQGLTPFLRRALTEAVALSANGERCFHAAQLSRALWPDSPGWQRTSNCGIGGATKGSGIRRAAGRHLSRLHDLGLVRHCGIERHHGLFPCYGYYVTSKGLQTASEQTDGH